MLSAPKGLWIFPHLFFLFGQKWNMMEKPVSSALIFLLPMNAFILLMLRIKLFLCWTPSRFLQTLTYQHMHTRVRTHAHAPLPKSFFQASHRLCCKWFPLIAFFWGVEGGCELISPPTCGLLQELCCSSMAAPVDLTLNYSMERLHWVRCCQEARLILLTTTKLEAKSTIRMHWSPTVIQYVAAY